MPDGDLDLIRHALQVARERGFSHVELEVGDLEFEAELGTFRGSKKKSLGSAVISSIDTPSDLIEVTAPVVGYYKAAGEPLEVGREIQLGEVVAVVAALGLANDVESPATGVIEEVLVQENDPVQYGQALARVKASS